jgi:hypothetical protein
MAGAILRANGADDEQASAACGLARQVVGGTISSFNDAPERTQAEVVAKLRAAAALAKAVSPQEMKG